MLIPNGDLFVRDKEKERRIVNAVAAVKDGMSKKMAAKRFRVPRSTIQYRMGTKFKSPGYGPSTFLTIEEEETLVKWIFECHRKGFPRRVDDIQASVQQLVNKDKRKTPFRNGRPGIGWYKAFLRRHPEVIERTSEAVTSASAPISEKDIRKWFAFLEAYFTDEGFTNIFDDPSRVYNGDETNFLLCPKNKKVLAPKGSKNVYEVDQGLAKASLTVMFTFGADGSVTPPMVIYPYKKNVPKDIADTVPDDWGIGHSDNGWMKSELFVDYILNIFNPYLLEKKIKKPVVLFVDGHRTHLTIELSELCTKQEIVLVCLYPNATRILQPADVAAFKPLKTGWLKAMIEWRRHHPNIQFTKANFAPLLEDVIKNYLKPKTIINGFRATGLWPWNADAIDYSKCLGGQSTPVKGITSEKKTMTLEEFKMIVGEEETRKLENGNTEETNYILQKLYNFFKNEKKDDTNDTNNPPVIVNLDETTTETNDENTFSEDKELSEELAKFDNLMDHINKKDKIATIESSPPLASCSTITQITESSPADLTKLLYWPPTPIRKNVRTTDRKHYVVTSKQFQNEFKTKEETKKKLEEEKLKKKEIREQKKKKSLKSKVGNIRILSNVQVVPPAKRKKIENNNKNYSPDVSSSVLDLKPAPKVKVIKIDKINDEKNINLSNSTCVSGTTQENKDAEDSTVKENCSGSTSLVNLPNLADGGTDNDKGNIIELTENNGPQEQSLLLISSAKQSNSKTPITPTLFKKSSPALEEVICEFGIETNLTDTSDIKYENEDLVFSDPDICNSVQSNWPSTHLPLGPLEKNRHKLSPVSKNQSNTPKTINVFPARKICETAKYSDLENIEPDFIMKEQPKPMVIGICYGCSFNINKRKMGLQCSKCTRTYHLHCFKGVNGVCPKC